MSETSLQSTANPKFTLFVNPIPQANGLSTLEYVDNTGRVVSVDQAGNLSNRPAGTAGPNELCLIDNNVATFFPAPQFGAPGAIVQAFIIVKVPQS